MWASASKGRAAAQKLSGDVRKAECISRCNCTHTKSASHLGRGDAACSMRLLQCAADTDDIHLSTIPSAKTH
eukprot:5413096-Amphidinium_carterae.1